MASGGERLQQLFGTTGRNTGLITYLAFAILFVVAMAASSSLFLNRFLTVAIVVGVASLGYGVIQALGGDPFDWVNPYSPVFGFLGNPNFQSSLLGILGAVVFTQLLSGSVKIQVKGAYLVYLLVTLYVIKETASQQGFLVLLIGSAISLGVFVYGKSRALGYSYLGLAGVGFVAVLIGTLNKGPLASLLYKDSVTYRGDYWRAGWKMSIENPLFGVGLDSYGDWYRRARTIEATLRRGPDIVSNAAHNVLLDFSSNGGFPLLIIYLFMMFLVVTAAFKVIKRNSGFDPVFSGLVAVWMAYQAQSIISLNQLGLAVWGWIISGLIIGYEINTREVEILQKVAPKGKSASVIANQKILPKTVLGIFAGALIGLALGVPPLKGSADLKKAFESQDLEIISEKASKWPIDSSVNAQIQAVLANSDFEKEALLVARDSAKRFPDTFDHWKLIASVESSTLEERKFALAQMKRLDPNNPDLK
jgi:O-antigen ligase